MKTQSQKTKIVTIVTLVLIAAVGAAFRARAQEEQPPPTQDRQVLFGMLGVGLGQTVRLNVSNLIPPPVHDLPPGPSRVELSFVDGEGDLILNEEGQPARRVVLLEPGRSAFLQLNADDLLSRDQLRLHVRPVVTVLPPLATEITIPPPIQDRHLPPSPIIPTLEVIENATGKTALLYPGVIRGFNPQPDPPRN